jgi:hypothetical protein
VTRIAVPALTVMLAVAGFVAAGAWNRASEPRLVITLTERELPVFEVHRAADERPTLRVRLAYEGRHDPLDTRNWLPESRLREIGFPFNVPIGSPDAADEYANVPARTAWIALEYDGQTWRDIERRRRLRDEHARAPEQPSRLVPVDAAAEFDRLRARYPTGHLIVRGIIGVAYLPPEAGGPLVYGTLRELVPSTIPVPAAVREVFRFDERAGVVDAAPRYEADLGVGRFGVPYIRAARRLE